MLSCIADSATVTASGTVDGQTAHYVRDSTPRSALHRESDRNRNRAGDVDLRTAKPRVKRPLNLEPPGISEHGPSLNGYNRMGNKLKGAELCSMVLAVCFMDLSTTQTNLFVCCNVSQQERIPIYFKGEGGSRVEM